jgi:hypothetical protein
MRRRDDDGDRVGGVWVMAHGSGRAVAAPGGGGVVDVRVSEGGGSEELRRGLQL